mgnify:CR=1 FL=1
MTNDQLNTVLLEYGKTHFGHHENVSLYFWQDHDQSLRLRWLVAGKNGDFTQGSGETLAAARADWIARRTEKIAALEAQLSNLKAQ